jgi:hypothetical protein
MKKIFILISFLIVHTNGIFAQEKQIISNNTKLDYKHLALKFSPLYLLGLDNTVQFGLEHRLNKKSNVTLNEELGFGKAAWNAYYTTDSDIDKNREIFRAKLELRKYRNDAPKLSGNYIAYELFYKQVNGEVNRSLGKECENGNCNYYERINYKATKYAFGGNINFGKQIIINNNKEEKNNLIVDLKAGFGIRSIIYDHKIDDPNNKFGNVERFGDSFFATNRFGSKDQSYLLPNINIGISIGWVVY